MPITPALRGLILEKLGNVATFRVWGRTKAWRRVNGLLWRPRGNPPGDPIGPNRHHGVRKPLSKSVPHFLGMASERVYSVTHLCYLDPALVWNIR